MKHKKFWSANRVQVFRGGGGKPEGRKYPHPQSFTKNFAVSSRGNIQPRSRGLWERGWCPDLLIVLIKARNPRSQVITSWEHFQNWEIWNYWVVCFMSRKSQNLSHCSEKNTKAAAFWYCHCMPYTVKSEIVDISEVDWLFNKSYYCGALLFHTNTQTKRLSKYIAASMK